MNVSAIVVMLWSLLAAAQTVPGSRIEGTVVDAVTGKPLSGVAIMAISPTGSDSLPAHTVSTAEGRFTLDNVLLERVIVGASKPGYPFDGTLLTLAPGSRITNIELRLRPTGIIVGRVMGQNGRPAVQARVQIQKFRTTERNDSRPDFFTTNDRGEFRADLEPGTYLLAYSSGRQPRASFDVPSDGATGQILYPEVTDTSQAVAVEVKPGEETRIRDVVLSPVRPAAIRFHIINDTGQKPPSVIDFGIVAGKRAPGFNGLFVNVEGGWDREVTREYWPPLPGTYGISAGWRMQDAEGALVLASKVVEFTGTTIDVELRIAKNEGRLRGRVMEEDPNGGAPKPFDNARVSLRSDSAAPIDDVFLRPDGTFGFSRLPLGRYEVRLEGLPGDYYVTSPQLDVVVGKDEATIDFTVASGALSVRGKVTNASGAAAHNAMVVLAPVNGSASSIRRGQSDQNGAFELTYVIPGEYRLYAFPARMFSDAVDAETLKKYEGRAKTVTIEKGARQQLTVPLLD